jgi:hypothetical protein
LQLNCDKIGCVWAGSKPIEGWQLVKVFCKIFVDGLATPFGPKDKEEIRISAARTVYNHCGFIRYNCRQRYITK